MRNRERLLRAAVELFGEQGYADTSVEDLLQATGVARSNFYYHFEGREGLARELVRRWSEERTEALSRSVGVASGAPEERIRRVFEVARDSDGEGGGSGVVASVALQRAPHDDEVRGALRSLMRDVERSLADALEELGSGREDAAVRTPTAARLGALVVVGAIDLDRAFPDAGEAERAEEAFLRMAAPPPEAGREPLAAVGSPV